MEVVKELGLTTLGGVNSAREQDSSFGGDAGYDFLGVVHVERVQVSVQEVAREEQSGRDTRRESERRQEEQAVNRSPWMAWRWNDARMQTLEP